MEGAGIIGFVQKKVGCSGLLAGNFSGLRSFQQYGCCGIVAITILFFEAEVVRPCTIQGPLFETKDLQRRKGHYDIQTLISDPLLLKARLPTLLFESTRTVVSLERELLY